MEGERSLVRTWLRIGCSLSLLGALAVCARLYAFPVADPVAFVCLVVASWEVARTVYLSRYHVRFDGVCVTLTNRESRRVIQYQEVRRVLSLRPSLTQLVRLYPVSRRDLGGLRRPAIPIGFEIHNVCRRLWTVSPDLLIQGRSGLVLLIPYATLGHKDALGLRAELCLKVGAQAFDQDSHDLTQAVAAEELAQNAFIAGQWEPSYESYKQASARWEQLGILDCYARCLRHMVTCLARMGRYGEAAGLAKEALELSVNMEDERGEAYILAELAQVEWIIGEKEGLDEALKYLGRAAEIHRRLRETFLYVRMVSNQALMYEQTFLLDGDVAHVTMCQNLANTALSSLKKHLRGDSRSIVKLQEANILGTLARCEYHKANWRGALFHFEAAHVIGMGIRRRRKSRERKRRIEKRKGCGAHHKTGQELLRAALRFARVPQKRKGCGAHHKTGQELLRAALRFARVP